MFRSEYLNGTRHLPRSATGDGIRFDNLSSRAILSLEAVSARGEG